MSETESTKEAKDEQVEIEIVGKRLDKKEVKIPESLSSALAPSKTLEVSNQNDVFTEIATAVQALDNIQTLAKSIIASKLCPLKTESDITIAILTGQQYGFPFMTSINNIYPINGKPAMGTHLLRAMVISRGIYFKKVYDCEPMYTYIKAVKVDDKIVPARGADGKPVFIKKDVADRAPSELHIRSANAVDYVTEYIFERDIPTRDGKSKKYEVKSSFSLSEATSAGLTDKDNWKNFLSRMLDARAFTFGSREIASDIFLGIYTISELADAHNISYTMSTDLSEEIS